MFSLEAKIRTESARETRENGMIPAVVYGKDVPSTMIALGTSDFIKVYREAGKSQIITLTVDGKKYNTLVQEAQRHPVKGNFLHLDFINVDMNAEIEVEIPLELTGDAPAVIAWGQLHQALMSLKVKCLPKNIVESISVDISKLEMNDVIHVSDIKVPSKLEVMNSPEEAVVSAHEIKEIIEETPMPTEAELAEETEAETPKNKEA